VLLVASVLVTFEAMIEPSAANVAGLWLVMGFVLARPKPPSPAGAVSRRREPTHRHVNNGQILERLIRTVGPEPR
jgi:hypothetical protein